MSDIGMKISLPGFDVKTATPEQCAIHSSFPPPKSKANQDEPHFATLDVDFTGGITQGVTHTLYQINHGYNYVPFNFASIILSNISGGTTLYGVNSTGVGATLDLQAECTSSLFRVTIFDDFNWITSSTRLQVSYYVFAENGS